MSILTTIPHILDGRSIQVAAGNSIAVAVVVEPGRPILTSLAVIWRADLIARLFRLTGRKVKIVVLFDDSVPRSSVASSNPITWIEIARHVGPLAVEVFRVSDFGNELRNWLAYMASYGNISQSNNAWWWPEDTVQSVLKSWHSRDVRIIRSIDQISRYVASFNHDTVSHSIRLNLALEVLASRVGAPEILAITSNNKESSSSLLLEFNREAARSDKVTWAAGVLTWYAAAPTPTARPLALDREAEQSALQLLFDKHTPSEVRLGSLIAPNHERLLVEQDTSQNFQSVSMRSTMTARRRIRQYEQLSRTLRGMPATASHSGNLAIDAGGVSHADIEFARAILSGFDVDSHCRRCLSAIRTAEHQGERTSCFILDLAHVIFDFAQTSTQTNGAGFDD